MSSLKKLKSKRFIAGIIALMMLAVVLLCASFIAVEADHDCSGDDCPICACIQQCENTLTQIGSGDAGQVAAIIPVILFCSLAIHFVCIYKQETPVSRKVRLNN